MSVDDELDRWRSDWKSDAAPLEDLRRTVDRDTAWLRLAIASDLLLGVAFAAAATGLALRYPHPAVFVLSGAVWVLTLVAVTFSVRNQLAVLHRARPRAAVRDLEGALAAFDDEGGREPASHLDSRRLTDWQHHKGDHGCRGGGTPP